MARLFASILSAAVVCLAFTAAAQAQVETVVVTGSRAPEEAPGVFIIKRADHVITSVSVTCDTRDAKQRREELKATLRNMMHAAAATSTISLGIGEKTVDKLNEADFDDIISSDSRPDTSRVVIIVKTTVSPTETLSAPVARITEFIKKTVMVGRTEVIRQGDFDLTLIAPEQYRAVILAKIVDDAKAATALFGPGYGVSMEGLERSVSWYQKAALDLALYIPYSLKITPLGH